MSENAKPRSLPEARHVNDQDWMVQRFHEIKAGTIVDPAHLGEFYEVAKVFDVGNKISAIRWLPGRDYLEFDQTFVVLRRKAPESSKLSR